ncbi:MAG: hypothetical protein IPK82_01590 [Polyangiaceae bacterium]|nr:hypothetical protein [Polyangiaceae bacterium]
MGTPPPGGGYGSPPAGYGPTGTRADYGPAPGAWQTPNGGFAPMPQNFPPGYIPDAGTAPLEGGVPWEQKGGSFIAKWWETLKACNGQTRPFFAAAAQNEKGDALFFGMISGAISGAFIGLMYVLLFGVLSLGLALGMPSGKGSSGAISGAFGAGLTMGIGIFYAVLITFSSAVGAAIRPLLWGGLHHLLLMMLGGIGERKTFMHTVRVAAYAEGASMPWIWIPIAGPFIAMFYGIRNLVVGYDETHKCGTGKATLVLFAPFICCCLCNLFIVLLGVSPALFKP